MECMLLPPLIHAGYGLYISIDGSSNGNGFGILADGFNANVVTNTVNNGVTPAMLVENGYPAFTPPPFISSTFDNFSGTSWTQRSSGLPGIINDYTLNVQRQLPGFVLDAAYVGNVGTHPGSGLQNPNQIPISDVAKYGANTLSSLLSSPAGMASGVPAPFPNFST